MSTQPTKPKPCPWCGATNASEAVLYNRPCIVCRNCDCNGPSAQRLRADVDNRKEAKEEAWEKWNTRADTALEAARAALELLNGGCWTASVFHQWEEGRGARKFTNSSMASVDGEFKTEGEALEAAQNAITQRTVRARGHSINYARAKPYVSFTIPRKLADEIGRARDARAALALIAKGEQP